MSNRVILAVASMADDAYMWETLKGTQAAMFEAGPVSIKLAFYGLEKAGGHRPCITSRWVNDPDDMDGLIDKARAKCVCGCFVNIADIFTAALQEKEPVKQIVILDPPLSNWGANEAMARADELHAKGIKVFIFRKAAETHATWFRKAAETHAPWAESIFRKAAETHATWADQPFVELAERTGGAYIKFNPSVERVAERLPHLLKAVAQYAIGGVEAVKALEDQSADLLLEQMMGLKKPEEARSKAPLLARD